MSLRSLDATEELAVINANVEEAWQKWRATMDNTHDHVDYAVPEQSLQAHVNVCMAAARGIVQSAMSLVGREDFQPTRVLDVGCSIGFKALAAQERFPRADVTGIDPDEHALAVARSVAQTLDVPAFRKRPLYQRGVGEALPYDDGSIDFILSTTVIEHVKDVDQCLTEVARVLRPGGYFYMEAPNYLWPFEPHLNVVMPPLCPKSLLRVLVKLQGRGNCIEFVDHLQFVHPFWIERRFRAAGLVWRNGFWAKLERVLSGDSATVGNYHVLARLLRVFGSSRFGRHFCRMIVKTGVYPSLIYLAEKPA